MKRENFKARLKDGLLKNGVIRAVKTSTLDQPCSLKTRTNLVLTLLCWILCIIGMNFVKLFVSQIQVKYKILVHIQFC